MSIRVTFGANTLSLDGQAGRSVGDLRSSCDTLLSLSGEEQAKVGGIAVDDDTILADGASVEFVKVAGSKG
jgi:hypothetical protein